MKIAATYANGEIPAFRHTQQFKVYEVEDGKIVASEIIGSNGAAMAHLPDCFRKAALTSFVWRYRRGAINARPSSGIEVAAGAAGFSDAAVELCLQELFPRSAKQPAHSDHAHSHSCPNHSGTCHQ